MDEELYNALNYIFMTAIPAIVIGAVFYSLMRVIVSNIKDYIMFRWDDTVGMGSRVIYNGQEAIIKSSSFRKITLITEEHLILVPMSEWSKMAIIMPINLHTDPKTFTKKSSKKS